MSTLRDLAALRVQPPPPSGNAKLDAWLRAAADALNALPNLSVFSYATPESNVTASAPALGFNVASGVSRLWAKVSGDSDTGWNAVA